MTPPPKTRGNSRRDRDRVRAFVNSVTTSLRNGRGLPLSMLAAGRYVIWGQMRLIGISAERYREEVRIGEASVFALAHGVHALEISQHYEGDPADLLDPPVRFDPKSPTGLAIRKALLTRPAPPAPDSEEERFQVAQARLLARHK
jgi:hypothetical protein